MYKQTILSVPRNAQKLFTILLFFYPEQYRKKYGHEMLLLFNDMYQEELTAKGKISVGFWFSQLCDVSKGIIVQHVDVIHKQGMKKYIKQLFRINTYNIIGSILLLPAFIMFSIDLLSRIIQGDLIRYNRPVYAFVSHTPFYWFPVIFTWAIVFPTLAVLVNLVPLVKNIQKKKTSVLSSVFLKRNVVSIILLSFGLGILAIIKFHDIAPCVVHGLIKVGIGQLPRIISVCKNA